MPYSDRLNDLPMTERIPHAIENARDRLTDAAVAVL